MLTSFFGNSKPVHFLVLGGFLILAFVWSAYFVSGEARGIIPILSNILVLGATVLGLVVMDFIVSKNQLTRRNSFSIFFYTCFLAMVPVVFLQSQMLWANFFLLLALRRIISLRKESNSEKKILDAAVWITVASFFYFWSLLYFLPLLIAVVQKPNLIYKQLLIPIVGFFAVLLVNTALQILRTGSFSWFMEWHQPIDLDFSVYNSLHILIPATLILTLILFSLTNVLRKFKVVSMKEKSSYMLFFIILAISLAMSLCGTEKNGSEMVFLFAPAAILCANYIEGEDTGNSDRIESWFKELLLWSVMVLAILLLMI